MERFSVNSDRTDPYRNFKFRVRWEGRYVAGISRVATLDHSAEVAQHRQRGDFEPGSESSGSTKYESIALERGITYDLEFERWANAVGGAGSEALPADGRKDVVVDVFDEVGEMVLSYRLVRCWVSEFRALAELDAGANAITIEILRLEHEGWSRNLVAADPTESSAPDPE